MSSGTFDAAFPVNENSSPIIRPAPIVQAENRIFWGLFDDVQRSLQAETEEKAVHESLGQLFDALRARKLSSGPQDWSDFVAIARTHPIMSVLHQDPFTHRAFSKPRGYAGDAVMMDFIYGREEQWPAPDATRVGQQIFSFTTSAPASEGVRARRAVIAERIDRIAEQRRHPHILAIASGHLREAGLSAAVRRRKVGRFMALDADALSSAEVKRCYGAYGVETVTASFRRLLGGSSAQGDFDFVYSTGLFDYLVQRTARRLVAEMFRMLRPGGMMMVANFLPGVRDIGYMETFMDWNLVYRSRRDMIDLTMDIPEEEVHEVKLVSEECKNIVFLQLIRN